MKFPALTTTRALQLFQVMRQGAVLLGSVLLAKSGLSTADIGVYEMLLYLGAVFTFFWVNGFLQAMPAGFSKLPVEDRKPFVFNSFLVFCALSLIITGILFLGARWSLPLLVGRSKLPFLGWFCLFMLFNLPTFPLEYIYLLHKKPLWIVWWGCFAFGIQLAALGIPLFMGYGLEQCLQTLALLGILKFAWTLSAVWKYGLFKFRSDLTRTYLILSAPLILNLLVGNITVLFDHWLVNWWYQDEAVFAVFRYGAREFPLVQSLVSALGVALIPRLAEDETGGLQDMKSMTRKLGNVLFPFTIVLVFVSKPLFPLVFNPDFGKSAFIFNVYLLMISSRLWLPNSILLAKGATKIIFRIGLLELGTKVLLGLLLLWAGGLTGLAWSAVLAYWVEKIGLAWYLRAHAGISLHQWLDVRWFLRWNVGLVCAYLGSLYFF